MESVQQNVLEILKHCETRDDQLRFHKQEPSLSVGFSDITPSTVLELYENSQTRHEDKARSLDLAADNKSAFAQLQQMISPLIKVHARRNA